MCAQFAVDCRASHTQEDAHLQKDTRSVEEPFGGGGEAAAPVTYIPAGPS